jgi:hypothetical protein
MPFLTLQDGKNDLKALAIVKGGDYNNEFLYLNESDEKNPVKKHRNEINALEYIKDLKNYKPKEKMMMMNKLQKALYKDVGEDDLLENENVKSVYHKIKDDIERSSVINLPDDSNFNLIVSDDPKSRGVYYITGMSGSGKSYMAKTLAESYKKMYPEREIYLISKLDDDDTLDGMTIGKPKRLSIDSIIDDYPSLSEFEDCMVIFDDFESLELPKLKVIWNLINDLASQGRHSRTTLLVLLHKPSDYKNTRLLLTEATHFIIYPLSTSSHVLRYLLGNHLGLEKKDILAMKKMGRWVCISKNYPQYLISAHTAKILNQ